MAEQQGQAYRGIRAKLEAEQCVVLDGGVTTELQRVGLKDYRISDSGQWGTWALYHAPHAVSQVHRRFVDAGCDVISTNTWALLTPSSQEAQAGHNGGPAHWMDAARLAVQLARGAIADAGRTDRCAVAFSINGDINRADFRDTLRLLSRVFERDTPDLILMETLSLIRENVTFPAVELMLQTGLPVWLSFRRCRHGVCGVHGQHWGGPEGDLFGRAARRFEDAGVGAMLINCLPVSHVAGMLPWLRDFTDLPLGVYPNLGRYLDPGWKFDDATTPGEYAKLALQWRGEGAQIIGGCCGVTPEHLDAAREALAETKPGKARATPIALTTTTAPAPLTPPTAPAIARWADEQGRDLYPLSLPSLHVEPDVFEPTEGSFLVWKYLFRSGAGKGQRCLDIGCGCGILAVQLALNGAEHVHAIDISRPSIANTMANAFRNGVEKRVEASVEDLYTFHPERRYGLIVASLYQMPVDPHGEMSGHRPADFWGRNMVDHLIQRLPDLLTDDGAAYLMQLSIIGQLRTQQLLQETGMTAEPVDFDTFHFSPVFLSNIDQIRRVEQISDAYHLTFGKKEVMVAYLLKITRRGKH